jgi:WD40 repeat protein
MTAHDDFDRQFSVWLQEAAPRREPEPLLGKVLARTARTRRRPAWRIPERWIPMTTVTTSTTALGPAPWRTIALLAVLLVGLVGGALLLAGAQRQELPPPFGMAANGVIAYSLDGSIVTAETPTGEPTPIIEDGGFPWFSPDGSRFVFARGGAPDSPDARIWIANADGSDARELAGVPPVDWIEWSPQGDVLAVLDAAAPSTITLVRTDGSGSSVIETGLALVEAATFRPPDGAAITFKGRDADGVMGIYQVARDGSGLVRLELDPGFQTDDNYVGDSEYYFNDPVWDPTGATLLYHTLEPAPTSPAGAGFRLHVAEVTPAGMVEDERILVFDEETDDEFHATFLPDGQTIVFETIEGVTHQLWVGSTAVGSTPRALGVSGTQFIGYQVSPDGTQLIASWSANEAATPDVFQVDIASGTATPLAIRDDYSWQRRAIPTD